MIPRFSGGAVAGVAADALRRPGGMTGSAIHITVRPSPGANPGRFFERQTPAAELGKKKGVLFAGKGIQQGTVAVLGSQHRASQLLETTQIENPAFLTVKGGIVFCARRVAVAIFATDDDLFFLVGI